MDQAAGQGVRGALPVELGQAIRQTAADITAVLGGVSDTGGAVPGSQWTVGEAAAHLALANELMADLAQGRQRPYGDGTPQSLAAANAESLAMFGERRAAPLAAMIAEQAKRCTDALSAKADGPAPVTPLGPMDRSVLASYLLTHMLGHGYDLARALRRPHMVDAERVAWCVPFLLSVMPAVADRSATAGLTARYTIRLRGGDGAFGVTFDDGAVQVTPQPSDRPDCTILIDPVAFLLIALGRRSPWPAMARGQVLAYGRKPWLGPRFPALFVAP
ncbi:maleylpyruvate isomerase family mycothiol-dependent enzyme [Streptomyces fuscichromogenes]|uniref:maleylpyruvate isomerase family mycothiol-dependent enzyme n=1 Tax=Streptomyces fuscichromogenes TaxID=1324013 RepID=UPI00381E34DE